MTTGDWVSAVHDGVAAAAIVVGGAWAWWKFVKGRTFHRRAELELEACIVEADPPAVRVRATLKNTGSAKIPLRIAEVTLGERATGDEWRQIGSERIFDDHRWLESDETISDEVLVTLEPEAETNALRVRCRVYSSKRKLIPHRESSGWRWRRTTAWTRNIVIVSTPKATEGGASDGSR